MSRRSRKERRNCISAARSRDSSACTTYATLETAKGVGGTGAGGKTASPGKRVQGITGPGEGRIVEGTGGERRAEKKEATRSDGRRQKEGEREQRNADGARSVPRRPDDRGPQWPCVLAIVAMLRTDPTDRSRPLRDHVR